jgi:phospholipid transport system substrate-binding protein
MPISRIEETKLNNKNEPSQQEEKGMKKIRYQLIWMTGLIAVLFWVSQAGAALSPTEEVKGKANQVIKILNDPALKGNKVKRREMVTVVVEQMIDWPEVGRRTLAIHWRQRTPQEKEDFVILFRDLLKRTYSEKLDLYAGEEINYLGENVEGNRAIVKTKVISKKKGTDYSVDYRLIKKGERWLVYDIVIEGISAVNNYRSQFNEVITGSSYEELVKKMKNKEFKIKESGTASKGESE